ncbi:hypothetical protein F5146DRAFT_1004116 [Armillaria mellea]|nr:hypothetical protein F5146DRAFT_1004116 [Armillaria mellea]
MINLFLAMVTLLSKTSEVLLQTMSRSGGPSAFLKQGLSINHLVLPADRQVEEGSPVITYGDGPCCEDGGQPRGGVYVETYFGTKSDEVSLFAEGHVHLCGWITGGTVEVRLASGAVGGVGKKVAIDDGGLEDQIPERMLSIISGGSPELSMGIELNFPIFKLMDTQYVLDNTTTAALLDDQLLPKTRRRHGEDPKVNVQGPENITDGCWKLMFEILKDSIEHDIKLMVEDGHGQEGVR